MTTFTPQDEVKNVLFRGRKIADKDYESITSAKIDMSTDMVTEVELQVSDPGFKWLATGFFTLGTPVTYQGQVLHVSVVETGAGVGQGALTIRCRPSSITKLRKLTGKRTVKMTPADYVRAEVAAAGLTNLKVVAQPSAKRKNIVRDPPEEGQTYSPMDTPSAWTTIRRLAGEEGYIVFESNNTLYFGKPTWIAQQTQAYVHDWKDETIGSLVIPTCRASLDSEDVDISVELPLSEAGKVYPGYKFTLKNMPQFDGDYMVKSVSYPLAGPGTIAVSVSTIRNPSVSSAQTQADDAPAVTDLPENTSAKAATAIAYAKAQLGKPYSLSANPPATWDCSKLTAWAWAQAGIRLTAYTYVQQTECNYVDINDIQPGDLIFMMGGGDHHVVMYIGNNQIIEAPSPGKYVQIASFSGWYRDHMTFIGRPKGA